MKYNIKSGDKLSVKIGKRYKQYQVISCNEDGWIKFKNTSPDGRDFSLHIIMHQNHIKIPETRTAKSRQTKRTRRSKKQ